MLHVITGLGAGGAESMLYKLVSASRDELGHSVVSLTGAGTFGCKLEADGVPVACLGMRPGQPSAIAVARLARILRRERPDVIQSWMYHANLLAGVAAIGSRIPVVWGLHHTDVDPRHAKRLTHWTRLLCARLSAALPVRIVCCAESARESHASLGYRADRMVVIPNGFVLDRFSPDAHARDRVRQELSVPAAASLVGLVARVHPDKDHENFFAAASIVAQANRDALFLLAGDGAVPSNPLLSSWIDAHGLRSRVRLLGPRSDVPRLLAALDVLASSSRSEGFPQVLGEAMLCGVPCAATDCGDSREIVGPTGRIVRPRDPAALAGAILDLLALSPGVRAAMGSAASQRIAERYDIVAITRRYVALYATVRRRRPFA